MPEPKKVHALRTVQPTFDRHHLSLSLLCLMLGFLEGTQGYCQQFVQRRYHDVDGDHAYSVFVPSTYGSERPVPVILYLHGAGERGSDGLLPTQVGLGPYAQAWGKDFPFLVVFPQAKLRRGRILTTWQAGSPDAERALLILDEVLREFHVDRQRVALVGWSMGGYGAWSLGAAYPHRWYAVMPLSGGGDPNRVEGLKDIPVWALHGGRDALVPPEESRKMVEALKTVGGKVHYTELPETGHDLSSAVFANEAVLRWLLDPHRNPATLAPSPRELTPELPPFVPELIIDEAVQLSAGRDILHAISYGLPGLVPAELLRGRLQDMYDYTNVQGYDFSITLAGISYAGQLERIILEPQESNKLRLQLGLRNILLTIGGTFVQGARHGAQTGPITVGIGHNRPVWLTLDVQPYIEQGWFRLKLIASNFSIPPDAYWVSYPAGISTWGLGMTQDRVADGLVSGLYAARPRVEREVLAIVPQMIRQLEKQLEQFRREWSLAEWWPLPAFAPRIRLFPNRLLIDSAGISLTLGAEVAALDGSLHGKPVQHVNHRFPQIAPPVTGELHASLAPGLLQPITELLSSRGLLQINVLDVPEPLLHQFADRDFLERTLPALKPHLMSAPPLAELTLSSALSLRVATDHHLESGTSGEESDAPAEVRLQMSLPQLSVVVSQAPSSQSSGDTLFQLQASITEEVSLQLQAPSHTKRFVALLWDSSKRHLSSRLTLSPEVASDHSTQAERELSDLLDQAWTRWIEKAMPTQISVPDVVVGSTRLRSSALTSHPKDAVSLAFTVPTVKITNLTDEVFRYETKGPYSGWGGPYELAPGKSHDYAIPYPLTYRHTGRAGLEIYTLPAGSHSEYRYPRAGGPPRLFQAREPQP